MGERAVLLNNDIIVVITVYHVKQSKRFVSDAMETGIEFKKK